MSYNYGEFEGLESIEQIELDGEPWSFYLIGIWQDEEGLYYLGTDSGCSCPIPFENYSRDSLTGPLTREQAIEESTSLAKGTNRGEIAVERFWEENQ